MNYAEANALRYRLTSLDLPEGIDRAQFHALLTAGVLNVLCEELQALDDRRHAEKLAAEAISEARDWAAVARRVRDRDTARRSGAYIERRRAS